MAWRFCAAGIGQPQQVALPAGWQQYRRGHRPAVGGIAQAHLQRAGQQVAHLRFAAAATGLEQQLREAGGMAAGAFRRGRAGQPPALTPARRGAVAPGGQGDHCGQEQERQAVHAVAAEVVPGLCRHGCIGNSIAPSE